MRNRYAIAWYTETDGTGLVLVEEASADPAVVLEGFLQQRGLSGLARDPKIRPIGPIEQEVGMKAAAAEVMATAKADLEPAKPAAPTATATAAPPAAAKVSQASPAGGPSAKATSTKQGPSA